MCCFQDKPLSGTKTPVPISLAAMGDEQSTMLSFQKVTIYSQRNVCENRFFSTNNPIQSLILSFSMITWGMVDTAKDKFLLLNKKKSCLKETGVETKDTEYVKIHNITYILEGLFSFSHLKQSSSSQRLAIRFSGEFLSLQYSATSFMFKFTLHKKKKRPEAEERKKKKKKQTNIFCSKVKKTVNKLQCESIKGNKSKLFIHALDFCFYYYFFFCKDCSKVSQN